MSLFSFALTVVPAAFGLAAVFCVVWFARRRFLRGRRNPLTKGLLRPAGHRLREESDDLLVDIFAWMFVASFMPLLLAIGYLGSAQGQGGNSAINASIFLIPALCSVALGAYNVHRLFNKVMKVRTGWYAETAAGQELDQLMRRGAYVFHDYPAKDFNIDHVLICSAGVFAIETKSRLKPERGHKDSGKVLSDGASLTFPSWTETKPLEQAKRQADWLAKELTKSVGERIAVSPVLALPGWYVEQKKWGDVRVLNPRGFHLLLESRNAPLSAELVNRIVHQVDQKCRDVAPSYE